MKSQQEAGSGREGEPVESSARQEHEGHGEPMEMGEGTTFLKLSLLDEIIFYGLIIASLVGAVLLQVSVGIGGGYWLAVIPILAALTIYIEWAKGRDSGVSLFTLIRTQVFHWGSLLVAIELLRVFTHFGRINNEAVSLVAFLLLAQTTFLVGVYVDWRFAVVAVFQIICLIALAYLETYIWVIIAFAVGIIALGIYFHRKFPHRIPTARRVSGP